MVDQHNLMDLARDVEDNVSKPFHFFHAEGHGEPIAGNVSRH